MNNDLQALSDFLDKSGVSDESKRVALAAIWTQDELPDVGSDEQCEAYQRLRDELSALGPPLRTMERAKWMHTKEGILYGAYDVKIHAWEDRSFTI